MPREQLVTYGFMLPMKISGDSAIFFTLPNLVLNQKFDIDGHAVIVRPTGAIDKAGAHELFAISAGYHTAEAALAIGKKARILLLAAGAVRGIGLQTGAGEDI